MPADNGSGCHQDEWLFPSRPQPSQRNPEQLLPCRESPAWFLGVKSEQLPTQGKIFEDKIPAGAEGTAKPAEEVSEPHDHARMLSETRPTNSGPTH
jgi:hypothetical protein